MKLNIDDIIRSVEISLISIPDRDYIEEKLIKVYENEDKIKSENDSLEIVKFYYLLGIDKSSSYNIKDSIDYFKKSLKKAKSTKDSLWMAKNYSQLSVLYYKTKNHNISRRYFIKSINILKEEKYIEQRILVYIQRLLVIRWRSGNKYIIPVYLNKIIDTLHLLQDRDKGYYYIVVATTYIYFLGDQILAMAYFIEAMQLGEKYNEYKVNGLVLYYLGSIYLDYVQNPLEAIRNLEPLVYSDTYDSVVSKNLKGSAIISLVDAYIEADKLDEAHSCLIYFKNYITDIENIVDENQQIMLRYLKSKLILKENTDLNKALRYASDALNRYEKYKVFFKYTHFDFNINLLIGDIYFKLNQYDISIKYYEQSIELGKKWGKNYVKKSYYSLAKVYEHIGDYKKALESYKICKEMVVDIVKDHNFIQYQDMQKEFEKIYKDEEIRSLNIYNEEIKEQSYKDHLTDLLNRCYLKEVIKENVSLHHITAFMIDIDYFKKYNDNYGHIKGDFILSKIARCLQDTCDENSDEVIRYGGEEFLILSYNTDQDYIDKLAQNILNSVHELKIEHKKSEVSKYITVSIGVSNKIINNREDYNILIKEADKALYKAKDKGRNEIVKSIRQIETI